MELIIDDSTKQDDNNNNNNNNTDNVVTIDNVSYTLDESGNAINDKKEIVKTKDEIAALNNNNNNNNNNPPAVEYEQVEIEGVTYDISKTGDVVDKDGKVIKTKAELEQLIADNANTDDNTLDINTIAKTTGIVFTNDDNTPMTFENTPEGISKYVTSVYNLGLNKGAATTEQSIYSINPLIQPIVEHIKLNGSLDGFNQTVAYSSVKLESENEDQLISIIRSSRKAKGDSEADISRYVSYAKSDNKILEVAKSELEYLKAKESNESKLRQQQIKEKEQQDIANHTAMVSKVSSVVKEGKLKLDDNTEFIIPKLLTVTSADGKKQQVDSEAIIDYMTTKRTYTLNGKPITMTAMEAAEYVQTHTATIENKIVKAIRLLTGSSESDILKNTINVAATKKILKVNSKANPNNNNNNNNNTNSKGLVLKYNK